MKNLLSKEEQEKLMWIYHDDPALELVYGSFDRFVEARVGDYTRRSDERSK